MNLAKPAPATVCLLTTVALLILPATHAQAQPGNNNAQGAPVRVLNTDQEPVPVRVLQAPEPEVHPMLTLSIAVDPLVANQEQTLASPGCPSGTEFLVSGLSAYRSTRSDNLWEAKVRLEQRYSDGSAAPVDLVVVGHGRDQVNLSLAAGQPTQGAGDITLKFIDEFNEYKGGIFIAHVAGYCGIPVAIQGQATGPGTGGSPLPVGWDIVTNKPAP